MPSDDSPQRWFRGFGAFADTDIPERMRRERERQRDEWRDDDGE